ncbi:MAG TPA: glycosyltransferase [Gemmataceae bacterium]|nr:glycosyltransferase [Gemmataceae bacterium]
MHILFTHRAFPAQFGQVALELSKRYGWRCSFLIDHISRCPEPTEEMVSRLNLYQIPLSAAFRAQKSPPWAQSFGRYLEVCQAGWEALRALPDLSPDLVVGHAGLAPTLFLPELVDCPIVNYCEYYFAPHRRDLTYRIDLPPAEPAPFFPRCINAATLASLVACDAGYAPMHWQRRAFPQRFWPKIEVHFDGIDTTLYRPQRTSLVVNGQTIPEEIRVVTFVARGLESMRGFDLFMRVAKRICRERSDVLFVIAGDEETYYGWDQLHTGQLSFKQWVLSQGDYDVSRFVFLGHIEPARLAQVLGRSDLHIYLSVPFVVSWSLLNALASGCVVLGSQVDPVREVVEPGRTGLMEPLYDIDRLAETSLGVLANPGQYRPLGQAARKWVEEKYSLDVCIPELKDYFERVGQLPPS